MKNEPLMEQVNFAQTPEQGVMFAHHFEFCNPKEVLQSEML